MNVSPYVSNPATATAAPWTNPDPLAIPPSAAQVDAVVKRAAAGRVDAEWAVVAAVAGLPHVGLTVLEDLGVDPDRDVANLGPTAVLAALESATAAPGTPDRSAIAVEARRLLLAVDGWDPDYHGPDQSDTGRIGPEALAALLTNRFDRGAVVLAATRLQVADQVQRAALAKAEFWAAERERADGDAHDRRG